MNPHGFKHQLMQVMLILLVISFTAHLMWDWMTQIAPFLVALAALVVIWRVVFRGWRR